jgi:hypothetical protein
MSPPDEREPALSKENRPADDQAAAKLLDASMVTVAADRGVP